MRGSEDERSARRNGRAAQKAPRWVAVSAGAVVAGVLALGPQAAMEVEAQALIPTRNQAQADMAVAIERMCPALDARSGAIGPRAPDRTAAEDQLNIACANIVFNEGLPDGGPDLDGDDEPDVPGLQLPEATLGGVVQQLNGEELQAVQQRIGEIRDVQTANIRARLTAIRTGLTGPGISLAGLDVGAGDATLALGDLGDYQIVPAQWEGGLISRLGLFATGTVKFGDKDATETAEGFDFTTAGVTVGGDWRFTEAFAAGLAVGYSRFDADFDVTINSPPGQELSSDSVTLSLFGTFFPTDQLFFDAIASVGWNFYDSTRRLVVPATPAFPAINAGFSGDFDAFHYGFAANAGYEITYNGLNLTPIARVEYLRAEIDGYTEQTDTALGLTFADTDAESLTVNVGLELNYPISTPIGVLTPLARAEYVHEFLNDQSGVRIHYTDDPTVGPDGLPLSSFIVSTDPVDRDYGILGAGLAATFPAGWAAFVDYNTVVGLRDFTVHTFNFGVRKSF